MGNISYLNYDWYFKENHESLDLKLDNLEGFNPISLPHTNKETPLNNFDETISFITSTYKRFIKINDLSKIYHLVFEGIGHYTELYVNGKYVSNHKCGYTRFEADITPYLVTGNNEIALIVDSHEINQPPFGFVIDYLCFGGIYRECYLKELNNTFIENYYFHNDEENWYLDYKLNKNCNHEIEIIIKDENKIVYKKSFNNSNPSDSTSIFKLWDVDNPYLYNLEVNLFINNELIDSITDTIGFRTIKFLENGFYLNGKKLKIRGANRHQSYPYVGYAMPKRAQYEDAELIKKLGFNAVRTSHYPQSPDFLYACDKLGLLVFEEIPGWQNVGDLNWQSIAINNVNDMIIRDRNHPSIILWGVRINESGDFHDFYTKTNEVAHNLDKFRPTGGVRCFQFSELLEDVYTYNDFINSGLGIHLRSKEEVTDSNKPYLVSEYGGHMYPTKSFDNEARRTTHAMIHAEVINHALNDDKILATFAWCFADYNTHRDFGSGDLICYHGVTDIFRNIKYAAYPYMIYQDKPFLEVTSNLNIGEHNGGYIREFALMTNCEEVRMYHNGLLVNTFNIKEKGNCFLVKADELMGNLLITEEGMTQEESNHIKEIYMKVLAYDGIIRDDILEEYGDEAKKAWNYYGKYISNWGSRATPYTFEGYNNGIKIIEIKKGPQSLKEIKVTTSTKELNTKQSYDTCKVTLEAIGTLGNRVDYSFDSFKIEVSDELEIIGDDIISLIAGARSFYVKTKVKNGIGKIYIKSPRYEFEPITLTIKEI